MIDPKTSEIVKLSCDCEGFTFRKKCWHLYLLKGLIQTDLKEEVFKEEINWFKEKMLSCEIKLARIRDIVYNE